MKCLDLLAKCPFPFMGRMTEPYGLRCFLLVKSLIFSLRRPKKVTATHPKKRVISHIIHVARSFRMDSCSHYCSFIHLFLVFFCVDEWLSLGILNESPQTNNCLNFSEKATPPTATTCNLSPIFSYPNYCTQ